METEPNKQVEMNQEELDALINKKFAQGATKANSDFLLEIGVESIDEIKAFMSAKKLSDEANQSELEKANGIIAELTGVTANLESKLTDFQDNAHIDALARKHGITELDYFKYKYNQEKGGDGFEDEVFVKNLLVSNGVFVKDVPNPKNHPTVSNQPIKMDDYLKLSQTDRLKYKATDLIKG